MIIFEMSKIHINPSVNFFLLKTCEYNNIRSNYENIKIGVI